MINSSYHHCLAMPFFSLELNQKSPIFARLSNLLNSRVRLIVQIKISRIVLKILYVHIFWHILRVVLRYWVMSQAGIPTYGMQLYMLVPLGPRVSDLPILVEDSCFNASLLQRCGTRETRWTATYNNDLNLGHYDLIKESSRLLFVLSISSPTILAIHLNHNRGRRDNA